ncbi:uncharacterized protein SPSK_10539 [Sporothrix schenckii 1099-18]|uniref:Uncharacterized protein n=1 Tax=Sporothrix schenckii 1099-18 TaxID=1397361 RepID=A0A0F2LYI2_SPOSC|nr:uncharacterized protein SPSK_10539 [Sporothrix schenckii 1099-18]KJR82513.1 hypothetical protein SPSK_10539 [Sporothrix schenckii 1099-18]
MGFEGKWLPTTKVDGLSLRANHPPASLRRLHGSLFGMRCVNVDRGRSGGGKREHLCDYAPQGDFADPECPAFGASAADLLPVLLEPVIGTLETA